MANGSEMIEIQTFNANPGGDLQDTEERWQDTSVNTDVHKEDGFNASSTQSTPAHPSGDNNTNDAQHRRNLKVDVSRRSSRRFSRGYFYCEQQIKNCFSKSSQEYRKETSNPFLLVSV